MSIKLTAIYFNRGEIGSSYCEETRLITSLNELKRMICVSLKYVNKLQAGCHFTDGAGKTVSIVYDNMVDRENGIFNVICYSTWNSKDTYKMDRGAVKRLIMETFKDHFENVA